MKRFGTDAGNYSQNDHREFTEAKRILPSVDLREAARFYLDHHPEGSMETTITDAVEQFLAQQKERHLSARHISGLVTHTNTFSATFGAVSTRKITANKVLSWLADLGKVHGSRTVKNYYGSLSTFFRWCVRRRLMMSAPTDEITRADLPTIPARPKGILTVAQTAAMMAYLEKNEPLYVPWHVLQLFAGIRRAEVGRLEWDWIRDTEAKTITLPGWREDDDGSMERIVKTGDDWVLHDLPDNLWQWLIDYKTSGRIAVPGNKTVKRLRGKVYPTLKPEISSWPQNAMRHTFCTQMISLHGDAVKVSHWSRHSSPRQLYKSYAAKLVSRKEAEEFFAISPL